MPLPFLNDAGTSFKPPVYSGIVPSLLAAFSAPMLVSVVPSCFASSGEAAAKAAVASDATARAMNVLRNMMSSSECRFERERPPAAVRERREDAVEYAGGAGGGVGRVIAEVTGVLEVDPVLRVDVGGEAQRKVAA